MAGGTDRKYREASGVLTIDVRSTVPVRMTYGARLTISSSLCDTYMQQPGLTAGRGMLPGTTLGGCSSAAAMVQAGVWRTAPVPAASAAARARAGSTGRGMARVKGGATRDATVDPCYRKVSLAQAHRAHEEAVPHTVM